LRGLQLFPEEPERKSWRGRGRLDCGTEGNRGVFGSGLHERRFQIPASFFANPSFVKATEDGRATKD
jgi:hypothetical protein